MARSAASSRLPNLLDPASHSGIHPTQGWLKAAGCDADVVVIAVHGPVRCFRPYGSAILCPTAVRHSTLPAGRQATLSLWWMVVELPINADRSRGRDRPYDATNDTCTGRTTCADLRHLSAPILGKVGPAGLLGGRAPAGRGGCAAREPSIESSPSACVRHDGAVWWGLS